MFREQNILILDNLSGEKPLLVAQLYLNELLFLAQNKYYTVAIMNHQIYVVQQESREDNSICIFYYNRDSLLRLLFKHVLSYCRLLIKQGLLVLIIGLTTKTAV